MLRLEKSSNNQEITVHLNVKEGFFNRAMCIGVMCALAFHLIAFSLFHIRPFPIISSYIFPPLNVETDHLPNSAHIELFNQPIAYNDSLIPPHPTPSLPVASDLISESTSRYQIPYLPMTSFFNAKEAQTFTSIPPLASIPYKPIRYIISGDLSQRPLKQEGGSNWNNVVWMKETGKLRYFLVKFSVRIKPETGTIFWYEKTLSSGQKEVDRYAEDILLHIYFNPNDIYEHLSGYIDVLITLGEEKTIDDLKKNNFKLVPLDSHSFYL